MQINKIKAITNHDVNIFSIKKLPLTIKLTLKITRSTKLRCEKILKAIINLDAAATFQDKKAPRFQTSEKGVTLTVDIHHISFEHSVELRDMAIRFNYDLDILLIDMQIKKLLTTNRGVLNKHGTLAVTPDGMKYVCNKFAPNPGGILLWKNDLIYGLNHR